MKIMKFKNSNRVVFITTLLIISVFLAIKPNHLSANQQPNMFAPGEIMVQLKQGTDQDKLLSEALSSESPNLTMLEPVANLLSSSIKIPLAVKQLLSGRWILLQLDSEKLTAESLARLKKIKSIANVNLKTSDDKSLRRIAMQDFDITYQPESREFNTVSAKSKGHADKEFTALIEELAANLGYPVEGKVDDQTHLILTLDQHQVTLLMEKRLRELTSIIDAVELNQILQPM